MRTHTLTALLVVSALAGAVPQAAAQDPINNPSHEPVVDSLLPGATIVLRVDGMSCPFCAYGLEKRLRNIPAIDTTVVRVSDGLVLIRTRSRQEITDETLANAVRRAGFTLRAIERRPG